jgi:amino acid adenylation domain-containing protein
MSATYQQVQSLPEDKKILILERLRQRKAAKSGGRVIPPFEGSREILPLSFAQERQWFLHQLHTDNSFDNVPMAVRLRGRLNIAALVTGLRQVVERHEILRTNYGVREGDAYGFINNHPPISIPVEDWTRISPEERAAKQEEWIAREASLPFDLQNDQLIRARLLQVGCDEHVLVITMHHIVSDGWSKGLLLQELAALYHASVAGQVVTLPELPIQYADYAHWHHQEVLRGEVFQAEVDYWRQHLEGAPSMLELPFDSRAGLVNESHPCCRHHFTYPESLKSAINDLARREGATLFMVLLAAFHVLLARFSRQLDVVTGTPSSGRTYLETEGLIGVFLNALAIRSNLNGNPRFLDVLKQVKATTLGAFAHQSVPFEKLVEILQPQRMLKQNPLFQVVFIIENDPVPSCPPGQLQFEGLKIDKENSSTPYHLTLYTGEDACGLTGAFEYRTDTFFPETIHRMAEHFEHLLWSIAQNPGAPIGDLSLFDERSRDNLQGTCQGEQVDHCRAETLNEAFAQQVERTPHAPALTFEGRSWSYRELDRKSNQLARHLKRKGVRSETVVGVAVGRSPELMMALIAIVKAGGACLPLDLEYPPDRLKFMVQDSGAKMVILGQEQAHVTAIGLDNVHPVFIDSDEVRQESEDQIENLSVGHSLAYVIYTSGSTGTPKGVMGTHQGALNRIAWMEGHYPPEPGEVWCQKTSLSFVDAVAEIWGALLAGVPLVIAPVEAVQDPRKLVKVLEEHKVTRIVLVPSLLRVLLEEAESPAWLSHLRLWIASGEELSIKTIKTFTEKLPGRHLLNLYGSAEVAADAAWFDTAGQQSTGERACIGRPISNTSVYVLDEHKHLVPMGVNGEIHVAGDGLARGYLGRPDLTADRFIPDPFSMNGGRLYRTGDRARLLNSGDLEYWGRGDQQIKIRGQRIELEEVESVLRKHPAVEEGVVLALGEADRELAAFVKSKPSAQVSTAELREFLHSRLPGYMVPNVWQVVESVPLLPNGKLDRQSLKLSASPGLNRSAVDPPQGAVEEAVAQIWEEVLAKSAVGRSQNFFDLGGHSLLAVRVTAKIYKQFSVDITLRDFFDIATVSALAGRIEESILAGTDAARLEELLELVESADGDLT